MALGTHASTFSPDSLEGVRKRHQSLCFFSQS